MDDPSAVVAEAELSGPPPGRTVRLVLDLGYATDEAAALARNLARGRVDPARGDAHRSGHRPAPHLRDALGGLAGALAEQTADRATVIALDTPLAGAWRAHPAQWER